MVGSLGGNYRDIVSKPRRFSGTGPDSRHAFEDASPNASAARHATVYGNELDSTRLQREAVVRVGSGFDLHRLAVGRRLVLGGVELPWDMGLQGHSDADVICHALIDALCGAAGIGDIGTLFPDDDPRYRDARSLDLLREVTDHCRRARWLVENADVTLLAQVPRLAPYREEIRNNLAGALGIDPAAVGLKATTTDHVGAIGQGEALAAQAVVLLKAMP